MRGAPILPSERSALGENREAEVIALPTFVILGLFVRGIHPKEFARGPGKQSRSIFRREFLH